MRRLYIAGPIILFFLIVIIVLNRPPIKKNLNNYQAMMLVLKQTEKGELFVESLTSVDTYPLSYNSDLKNYYLNFDILDFDGKSLYKGKVMDKNILFSDAKNMPGGYLGEYNIEEITLILPIYPVGKMIRIADENNNEKLSIDLKNYPLTVSKEIDLCGNGICDGKERIYSCWRDCGVQVKEFFRKVAP